MSNYAAICDWLREEYEKKNIKPSLQDLEHRRDEIADKFDLKNTNKDIAIAFEKYLNQLPERFKFSDKVHIINGQKILDNSWIVEKSNRFYWNNLNKYLIDINRGDSISSLDLHSETILKNLAPSNSLASLHVKGLVVGYVQSGKTANMIALSAKAVDCGYKMVIVLGGLLNSLRQQTQVRFDQELTGGDKQLWQNNWKNLKRVTFSKVDKQEKRWQRFTGADSENPNKGDFSNNIPSNPNLSKPNQAPSLFVIKKTPSKIKALAKFIKDSCHGPYPFPVLILDDESDQATINTKYNKQDVTSSNESIRELLKHFSICSYVGYTATPYANILIDPTYSSDQLGRDLFPKDFIYPIDPPPPGYYGVKELFGINVEDPEQATPGLDIFVSIPESDIKLLNDSSMESSKLTRVDSLIDSIDSFIISSAIRLSRGHKDLDFSMLIHPSSYTQIQNSIYKPLLKYLDILQSKLSNKIDLVEMINKLDLKYKMKYKNQSIACQNEMQVELDLPENLISLKSEIVDIISSLKVLLLHSGSQDKMLFGDKTEPKRYIIVGGNKLSRGLTIEGLSVSYFCRNSRTYDTLLQMGRWFGYRSTYVDLTRIYLSNESKDNFQSVAFAELDLRDQLSLYASEGKAPVDVLPRIVQLPNLLVTARNKLGAGKKQLVNFTNFRPEKSMYEFSNYESLNNFNNQCKDFLKMQNAVPCALIKSKIEGEYLINSKMTSKELLELYVSKVDLGNIDKDLLSQFLSNSPDVHWVSLIAGKNESDVIDEFTINGTAIQVKGVKRSIRLATRNRFGTILGTTDLNRFKMELNELGAPEKIGMIIFHFIDCKYLTEINTDLNLPKFLISPVFVFPRSESLIDFDRIGINELSDDEKEALNSELPLLIDEEEDEE